MRTRWRNLFCCSVLALTGNAWVSYYERWQRVDWINAPIAGLVCATLIALVAVVTDTRKRWPAGAALVCLAPLTQSLYELLRDAPLRLLRLEMRDLLMLTGVTGALIVALHILVFPPLPTAGERVPRARST